MRAVRRVVRSAVFSWLSIQLLASVAAPFAMCARPLAVAREEHACCPGVGPGQVCPMHHTREGATTCAISAACGSSNAALVSLLFVPGLDIPRVAAAAPLEQIGGFILSSEHPLDRTTIPDAPPPRG